MSTVLISGGLSGYIIGLKLSLFTDFVLGGVQPSSILVSSEVSIIYFRASIQIQDGFHMSILMIVQTTDICSFQ